MPKRTDIRKILVIGSGPIVIGQAAEFDYSGSQACKALRSLGYEVVLVNSNPATIMTDPEMADKIYIEPLTPEIVAEIIKREKPDALLPTLGGQTGLNIAAELWERGILQQEGVELIGAKAEAIMKGEDRELFKRSMEKIGLKCPDGETVNSVSQALNVARRLGYPVVVRPAFTLGGTGGGIAFNDEELRRIVSRGLELSRIHQVIIDEALLGWKEYEFEVMRDLADNVVIVCSIENFDPMGIHTGDSITVAPAQTLSNREYQILRDASIAVIREIGVETGGSNIQFAVHPETGEFRVIEINPRVSRSSALASKATGFPIAKIAAKLAVGLTLDEIPNDITKKTPACFEPTIDYVVVKIPRWNFEKFPTADDTLTTQMKSVGEVMAIGRTFEESLQKAIRSLEIGRMGICADGRKSYTDVDMLKRMLHYSRPRGGNNRIFMLYDALKLMDVEEVYKLTYIDKWFLQKLKNIAKMEEELSKRTIETIDPQLLREAKRLGFSDYQIAYLLGTDEMTIRKLRKKWGILPIFKFVDTCAAEFDAETPYYYSTYEDGDDSRVSKRKKVVILGSGPNRIGQGIEFDYCCVHGVLAAREEGYETIMINCNPETVSTDYDTSDKLYFEPLTFEDVMNIVEKEQPIGVVLQFGGQTPLNLAVKLANAGVPILGTSSESIDIAEDRERCTQLLKKLGIPQAPYGCAKSVDEAVKIANEIEYPVLVRPSYVLGGRAMQIVHDENELRKYFEEAVLASPEHPVLVDKFLQDAVELDIDAVSDGEEVFIPEIMEHIEEAGIHSGDSACTIPPRTLDQKTIEVVREYVTKIAKELKVVGLINVQMAVKDGTVYVLEINPRASRTVPFVSKATGIPMAKVAMKVMLGKKLRELGISGRLKLNHFAVKESVFPFQKLPGVDPVLGPEMKSTGEVMGIDVNWGRAFFKAELAAGNALPASGTVFLSVRKGEQEKIIPVAKKFQELGFEIVATEGTANALRAAGIPAKVILKVSQGSPNVLDLIKSRKVDLIINIPTVGRDPARDGYQIRRAAIDFGIPYITTIEAATAAVLAIEDMRKGKITIQSLNEYHAMSKIVA
ncbi:MAG: carbamoyl-phosphate synthase large subunit [Candidatus Hadarchaeales archaeon]